MCGIFGMCSPAGRPLKYPGVLDGMGHSLTHRGPDARGRLVRPHVALGANRLRIVDPDPRGDQPFTDPTSNVWLACNGEIYNAREIRSAFPEYPFRSRSDAESILPLYLAEGPEGLARLDGMFAVALWDERAGQLILARDRAGEKPLFYARPDGEICFASEIQALLRHPGVGRGLDLAALDDYVTYGFVLEPRAIFSAVRRVEAGTILVCDATGGRAIRYWEPSADGRREPAAEADEPPSHRSAEAPASERLAKLLQAAVHKQLTADVPVGVFTSGGLDSSLLVALAARAPAGERLHTFSVRFPEPSYDEGAHARAVARHFGTRHIEVTAGEPELGYALDTLVTRVAEPIADPAVLPTWLLAREARRHVGVALTGEGADELFGGYPTYLGHKLAPWFCRSPAAVRSTLRRLIGLLDSSYAKVPLEYLLRRFVAEAEKPWFERHVAWFGTGLPPDIMAEGVGRKRFAWPGSGPSADPSSRPTADVLRQAMLLDYATYLRNNLLVKIDRATMLVSLEARAPYLDRDLTAFALALPSDLKVRGLTAKWLLRRVARQWLPGYIAGRTKRGLSVPISGWINGALRPAVERLLAPERLRHQGLLNPKPVGQLLSEHRAGRLKHARGLWALVVLQLWMERWT